MFVQRLSLAAGRFRLSRNVQARRIDACGGETETGSVQKRSDNGAGRDARAELSETSLSRTAPARPRSRIEARAAAALSRGAVSRSRQAAWQGCADNRSGFGH